MRVLAIVHEDDAGPGVFAQAAHARGVELIGWRIAAGERCPEDPRSYDAVLSLGGAMHAFQDDAHPWLADEHALLASLAGAGHPVLGVCLGAQILARATGGRSGPMPEPEIGWYDVEVTPAGREDPLLGALAPRFGALQWHSCDFMPGSGAVGLAASARCQQAARVGPRAWSIQFHAEVTLANFEGWLDQHLAAPQDGDAPADPEALRASTRSRIESWNALGRDLFGRFLDVVSPG